MIFNTSGSSEWKDVSAEFMAENPDFDAIIALTNGKMVYVNYNVYQLSVFGLVVPSGYEALMESCGSGADASGQADIIVIQSNQISSLMGSGDGMQWGTIVYSI